MTNPNEPAHPQHGWSKDPEMIERMKSQAGLTKREFFAAMAMQGLIACLSSELTQSQLRIEQDKLGIPQGQNERVIVKVACDYADALISELSK